MRNGRIGKLRSIEIKLPAGNRWPTEQPAPVPADLDYDLDSEAGTILFRGPVAPFDRDLNPIRITVIYEARGGGGDRTVDVHLSWLRRKLGESAAEPRYLHSVRGVGVKLAGPEA